MISPLTVGGAVAVVMAGPPLYGLVQSGEMDGTSALGRGLLVAGACAFGASYVLNLIGRYEKEEAKNAKQEAFLTAVAEAEAANKRKADAIAAAAKAAQNKPS